MNRRSHNHVRERIRHLAAVSLWFPVAPDCHEATALRAECANIPTRKSDKPWKTNRCGPDTRNDILCATAFAEQIEQRPS